MTGNELEFIIRYESKFVLVSRNRLQSRLKLIKSLQYTDIVVTLSDAGKSNMANIVEELEQI